MQAHEVIVPEVQSHYRFWAIAFSSCVLSEKTDIILGVTERPVRSVKVIPSRCSRTWGVFVFLRAAGARVRASFYLRYADRLDIDTKGTPAVSRYGVSLLGLGAATPSSLLFTTIPHLPYLAR